MTPGLRSAMLGYVRAVLAAKLAGGTEPTVPAERIPPADFAGVFVTLRRAGRLRGCMGRFGTGPDAWQTVRDIAECVLSDPRFTRDQVTAAELPALEIEISVLSPMARTHEPLSLEPGVHGVMIRRGHQSGCFLPQVATEQGWDTRSLLSICCSQKAGLPADAWQWPDTEVYLFTAEVFGDADQRSSPA